MLDTEPGMFGDKNSILYIVDETITAQFESVFEGEQKAAFQDALTDVIGYENIPALTDTLSKIAFSTSEQVERRVGDYPFRVNDISLVGEMGKEEALLALTIYENGDSFNADKQL